jgi:esterase/lipase superfamily enzyme
MLWRTFLFLSILYATDIVAWAQQLETEVAAGIPVPAFSIARSPLFTAAQGDIVVVIAGGPQEANIEPSVYNSAHVLYKKEDPTEPTFEFRVPSDQTYYVSARNLTGVDATFSVYVRHGARVQTPQGKPLDVVRVFYATNRAPAKPVKQRPYYLNEPDSGEDYSTGFCYVRIPPNHKLGELETASTYQVLLVSDPGTDIRIMNLEEVEHKKFFDAIRDKASGTPDKQVLVFIHGFNVSFDDAARRAAQLSYDLAFPGATVLFSWPSHNSASESAFKDDQERADASAVILKRFLEDVSAQTGAASIHLIAHSLGNRVLTQALQMLASNPSPPRFRNTIMVAPAIDAATLKRISGRIHLTSSRLTLYTSTKDLALQASEIIGGLKPAGNHIVLAPDLETIDASAAPTELTAFSHSYYADSPIVLADLFHLLRGEPPGLRFALDRICKIPECSDGRIYWRFRPTARR